MLVLNGVQDFQASATEEIEVDSEFTIHSFDQRQALPEPVTGALNFKLHHGAECGSVLLVRTVVLADAEPAHIFQWQIDAAFFVIAGDILPKIGELQRSASEVGELLPLVVAISAEIEHQMADWIGGVVTISQHIVERFEASDRLILAEGRQQVRKFLLGDIELTDSFREGYEYRMPGSAVIAGV